MLARAIGIDQEQALVDGGDQHLIAVRQPRRAFYGLKRAFCRLGHLPLLDISQNFQRMNRFLQADLPIVVGVPFSLFLQDGLVQVRLGVSP